MPPICIATICYARKGRGKRRVPVWQRVAAEGMFDMVDEQSYHEQLDEAASEALTYIRRVITSPGGDKSGLDAAKFLLRLHLTYHTGGDDLVSFEDEDEEEE